MEALLKNIEDQKYKLTPPTFTDLVFKEWADSVGYKHGVELSQFEIKLDPESQVFGDDKFRGLWLVVYDYFLAVLKFRDEGATSDIDDSEIFPLMKYFDVEYSQFEELLRRAGLDGLGTESSEEILRAVRLVVVFFLMTVFMQKEGNQEKTLSAVLAMNNIHPESGPVLGPASPKALYTQALDSLVVLMVKHETVPKDLGLASSWPGLVLCLFGNLFVESGILSKDEDQDSNYGEITAESKLNSVLLSTLKEFAAQLEKQDNFTWKEF